MRLLALAAVLAGTSFLAGCGPSCQEACNRIHSPSECAYQVPGESPDTMYRICVDDCELALKTPGELGGYDPEIRNTSDEAPELTNDKQAAVWMDCVVETACEDLADGYCAPLF
jgi:hypothetical protein